MHAVVTVSLLSMLSGCFSFWGLSQLTGTQSAWEQNVREESVPMPGVDESLVVTLPLGFEYEPVPYRSSTDTTPPPAPVVKPFAIACSANQRGRDTVYRSAFRYGSRWKKLTAISFLAESAIAAAVLLGGDRSTPKTQLWGGFFAIDAIGTAAIFFIPRKEIYRKDEKTVITPIRNDCPDGLMLELGGDSFPINAAGELGELGDAALDQWMAAPTGALQVSLDGRTTLLFVGANEQCAWNRAHHPELTQRCGAYGQVLPREASGSLSVPLGTLTGVAAE